MLINWIPRFQRCERNTHLYHISIGLSEVLVGSMSGFEDDVACLKWWDWLWFSLCRMQTTRCLILMSFWQPQCKCLATPARGCLGRPFCNHSKHFVLCWSTSHGLFLHVFLSTQPLLLQTSKCLCELSFLGPLMLLLNKMKRTLTTSLTWKQFLKARSSGHQKTICKQHVPGKCCLVVLFDVVIMVIIIWFNGTFIPVIWNQFKRLHSWKLWNLWYKMKGKRKIILKLQIWKSFPSYSSSFLCFLW